MNNPRIKLLQYLPTTCVFLRLVAPSPDNPLTGGAAAATQPFTPIFRSSLSQLDTFLCTWILFSESKGPLYKCIQRLFIINTKKVNSLIMKSVVRNVMGTKGRSGTAEGRSGRAACSAGVCDDLTSGALLCHYRLSRQSCYMFLLLPFLPQGRSLDRLSYYFSPLGHKTTRYLLQSANISKVRHALINSHPYVRRITICWLW